MPSRFGVDKPKVDYAEVRKNKIYSTFIHFIDAKKKRWRETLKTRSAQYEYQCPYCRKTLWECHDNGYFEFFSVKAHVDHITPLNRGGTDNGYNVIMCCVSCNTRKGDKTALEFGYPDVQELTMDNPSKGDNAGISIKDAQEIKLLIPKDIMPIISEYLNYCDYQSINELFLDFVNGLTNGDIQNQDIIDFKGRIEAVVTIEKLKECHSLLSDIIGDN